MIECKSPYVTNPMEAESATFGMQTGETRKHEGAERLFYYNQMMVSTHRDRARVGTITSCMEHYLEWKDPTLLSSLMRESKFSGVVDCRVVYPEELLDIVQNFTVFEPVDGRVIKKIPRYQQYRAVQKRIELNEDGKYPQGEEWSDLKYPGSEVSDDGFPDD